LRGSEKPHALPLWARRGTLPTGWSLAGDVKTGLFAKILNQEVVV